MKAKYKIRFDISRAKSMFSATKTIFQTLQQHATKKLLTLNLIMISLLFSRRRKIHLAKQIKKYKRKLL